AHLSLHSLDAATLAELAAVHLGHAPSPQLLQLLAGRSDGNPFFAEQMLLYLRAQEAGQPNGASETELLLPLDVRAILVARIDQLRPPVKEVVQMAAVLGREFDARLLTAMLKGQPDVWARIGDAEQATIWTALSHARYLFRHALLRDAAYDMQLHARRRALHALAAAALETMHAADLRPHYAELVYHHGRAEQADPERRYAQLAGEQAAREFANADALRFLSRSLALTPPTDRQTRFDLLREREAVYHVLGQREHQKADLTEMARLAQALDQPQETAVTAIRLARFANVTSDFAASRAAAQLALGFARQTNRPILAADACLELGLARWRQGSYARAAQDVTTGLDLYRRAAHDAGVATARHYLALMAYEQGDYETSRRNYLEVLAIRRAQGDRQGEAATLTNLGAVTLFQADYESAIRYKEAALQLRRETGHRQGEGGLLLNLGVVNRILGQFAAARQLFEQALVISQNVGEQLMESVVYVNFSLLYHQMGEQAAAAEYGRIALANTRRLGNPLFQSSAHTWLGHALLAQQDAAGARQQYDAAIRLRRQIGQHHLVVEPLAGLARVALAAQDVVAAYQLGSTIHEQLDETPLLHGTEEPLRIYLTAYHSFLACSQPHVAAHVLRQAHALLQERAARLSPARRHAYLHAVPHHQQLLDLWQQQHPSP
ncbi:MAG: tetratricopeptide repeat protein, partial [Anaerolineales bacterium]|nr:tetratricopeptide repeat protein [Anaerolineales bacterium]